MEHNFVLITPKNVVRARSYLDNEFYSATWLSGTLQLPKELLGTPKYGP